MDVNHVVEAVITEPALESEIRDKNKSVIMNTLSNGIDDISVFEQKKLSAYDDLSNTGRYDISKRNPSVISSNTERVRSCVDAKIKSPEKKNYHPLIQEEGDSIKYHPSIQEESFDSKVMTPNVSETPKKESDKKVNSRGMLKKNSISNTNLSDKLENGSSKRLIRRSFNLKKPANASKVNLNLNIKDATPEKKPKNILRSSSNAMRKMNEKVSESERRMSVDFLESDGEGNKNYSRKDVMKSKLNLKDLSETNLCIDDVAIVSGRKIQDKKK